MKKCPYCAEEIQDEAIKCKHCGSTQPEQKARIKAKFNKVLKRIGLITLLFIICAYAFNFIYYDIHIKSKYVREVNSQSEEYFFKLTKNLYNMWTIPKGGQLIAIVEKSNSKTLWFNIIFPYIGEDTVLIAKMIPMRAEVFLEKYPNSQYYKEMETMGATWGIIINAWCR